MRSKVRVRPPNSSPMHFPNAFQYCHGSWAAIQKFAACKGTGDRCGQVFRRSAVALTHASADRDHSPGCSPECQLAPVDRFLSFFFKSCMAWARQPQLSATSKPRYQLSRYWQSHAVCVQVPGQLQRLAQRIPVGNRGALPGVVCRPEGPVDRVTYSAIIIYSDCWVWSTADHPPRVQPFWGSVCRC